MSLAVQINLDLGMQSGAGKGQDGNVSGSAEEFANMVERASSECSESCASGSAGSDSHSSSDGQSGKAPLPEGKNLPHDSAGNADTDPSKFSDDLNTINSQVNAAERLLPVEDLIDGVSNFVESLEELNLESDSARNLIATPAEESATLPPEFGAQNIPQTAVEIPSDLIGFTKITGDIANASLDAESQIRLSGLEGEGTEGAVKPGALAQASPPLSSGAELAAHQSMQAVQSHRSGVLTDMPAGQLEEAGIESLGLAGKQSDPGLERAGRLQYAEFQPNTAKTTRENMLGPVEMPARETTIDRSGNSALDASALKDLLAMTGKTESSSLLSANQQTSALGLSNPLGLSVSAGALSSATPTVAPTGSNYLLNLGTAVTDQAWADDFAVRIRTLVSGNVQQATLNLHPAELGAIEVSLSNEGNETKAQFVVQNAAVKDALEASLPRLREIFEESGLSLANTDVRDESMSQQTSDQEGRDRADTVVSGGVELGLEDSPELLAQWDGEELSGRVDYFI